VFIPEDDVPTEGGYGVWHDDHSTPKKQEPTLLERLGQKFLGWRRPVKNDTEDEPGVSISEVFVNCTAFPSSPNGRAYTGYFDSSSSLLNRVWYAGAWTLQLSTLDPKEGGSLIDFNRNFDHNEAPVGAWYSNYTIANGTTVTTDGAKRDRMVWPGDMTIAVPGIAVSTYDMLAVRNALNTIYDHQYGDGSMPYAGPPMGAFGEFSDTYHLHTLIGSYVYVLYSGDLEWLEEHWAAYTRALQVSINKVDEFNLLHVSSVFDWIRPGLSGHNVEASAILYEVLGNSIKLATWLGKKIGTDGESWEETRERLGKGIATLYCEQEGLYSDNKGRRGCLGEEKVLPQDGNSWALISHAQSSPDVAYNVSENLRARWIKYGAPAVEFPNVISPFASSFELLGHISANNADAAVELIELMWGYMLDGPGMTNSTLLEGYRIDGYIHYPAYWSDARNSHAHGWAAGPTTVLMQGILGISLISPLGKTWKIEPQLTKWLSYAQGGFATKLGKFEVSLKVMRSLSTGRKIEVLEASVPEDTYGTIVWGGEEQTIYANQKEDGTRYKLCRYLDGNRQDSARVWSLDDDMAADLVPDDTFVKPAIEERPAGVVDWGALEDNYGLAEQRFGMLRSEASYRPSCVRADGQLDPKVKEALEATVMESEAQEARIEMEVEEECRQRIKRLKDYFAGKRVTAGQADLDEENRKKLENALKNWGARVEAKEKQDQNKQKMDAALKSWTERVSAKEKEYENKKKLEDSLKGWTERVEAKEKEDAAKEDLKR